MNVNTMTNHVLAPDLSTESLMHTPATGQESQVALESSCVKSCCPICLVMSLEILSHVARTNNHFKDKIYLTYLTL